MMFTTQLPHTTANQGSVTIRALSSITSQQAETIAQAVHASERAWDMQTFDDYNGYLSIVIEPSVSGDKQKSFFISGTAQHLELFETQDDNMGALASFSDVEAISARLLDLIAQQSY